MAGGTFELEIDPSAKAEMDEMLTKAAATLQKAGLTLVAFFALKNVEHGAYSMAVSFRPDLPLEHCQQLSIEIIALLKKRYPAN